MYTIRAGSIYDAVEKCFRGLLLQGSVEGKEFYNTRIQDSRNGKTVEFLEPVTTVYLRPERRVLDWSLRRANPFFHLFEALWMLAGQKDVATLAFFNKNIAQYSDDGKGFYGAYGWRWRSHFIYDQLDGVIKKLRGDMSTRQAVLAMWDPNADLFMASKDIPCNDLIFFKIREGQLHMTVCCRSNDAIWGCYGANVVHFSILQEYVASMVGVKMGVYRQISDSLHFYVDNPQFDDMVNYFRRAHVMFPDPYAAGTVTSVPMVDDPMTFDAELGVVMQLVRMMQGFMDKPDLMPAAECEAFIFRKPFTNIFFKSVVAPMLAAWIYFKRGQADTACDLLKAYDSSPPVPSKDWLVAGVNYLSGGRSS